MRAGRQEMSQVPTSPSPTDDPLTRLWERAGASEGNHLPAIAELRERKRQQHDAPHVGRQQRYGRDERPDGGVWAPTDAPTADKPAQCERCQRTVKRASSERVEIPSPAAGRPASHLLCSRCADEVRRGLLRLLAGEDPLPAPAAADHDVPLTIPARAGWFALRLLAYALIAAAVFALLFWLTTH
jgi:hypothetical protein